MIVAHLGVFLDAEGVLLVASNRKPRLIDRYHAIARRSFKDMKLNHRRLRCCHNFELGEAHLEHHVASQGHLLSDHYECAGR
mmetsp:Transcript_44681/g.59283  ORF Transcript_44681/g.59283 Transcript_44681/m.59283 type:complete len:82 (-) Transcript_44681:2049-2294(-)